MIEIHLVFNVLLSPPLRGGEKGEGEKEPFYPPPPHAPRRVHDCPEPYMVQGSPSPPACAEAFCLRQGFGRQAAGRRPKGEGITYCYGYKFSYPMCPAPRLMGHDQFDKGGITELKTNRQFFVDVDLLSA